MYPEFHDLDKTSVLSNNWVGVCGAHNIAKEGQFITGKCSIDKVATLLALVFMKFIPYYAHDQQKRDGLKKLFTFDITESQVLFANRSTTSPKLLN